MILRCEAIFSRAAASILVSSSQQLFERLARLLPDRVAIFEEVALVDLRESIGDRVGELVQFVARDPHSTALYLRASSFFTFLNISG